MGLGRLYYGVFDLVPPNPPDPPQMVEIPIKVTERSGGGIQDAAFAFNWNDAAAGVHVELWDPQGKKITPAHSDWVIAEPSSQKGITNVVYHYKGILPVGIWTAKAWTTSKSDQLLCILSGKLIRGVDVSLNFSQINDHGINSEYAACPPVAGPPPYLRGLPVTIQLNVNDSEGGIAGLRGQGGYSQL